MTLRRTSFPFLILSIVLTGCLPSSCNRVEPRDISSADSTSRAMAASMPVDTLEIRFAREYDRNDFRSPRTIMMDEAGRLFVSDTQTHTIHRISPDGDIDASVKLAESIPYLAGQRGDTTWVFAPLEGRVYTLVDLVQRDSVDLDLGAGDERSMRWVLKTDSGFVSKVLDDSDGNRIAFHNGAGAIEHRVELSSASWRYAGFLRERGDHVLSLSGFLPYVFPISEKKVDSLRLTGFDSPMLARTLQFERGTTDQPPLLSGSAAVAGDWLFVLNMRPGWLHIDVFNRNGELAYVLTEPDPAFNKEYYPTDISARALTDGSFEIAVTITEPAPGVQSYSWKMPRQ